MRARLIVPAAIVAMSFALTGCSDEGGNEADCKAEIIKQMKSGKMSEDRPDVCDGIDDKTLQRLAKEAAAEQMKGLPTAPTTAP